MFYTIKEQVSTELVEKKSKFIADLFPIQNQEEAENGTESEEDTMIYLPSILSYSFSLG